MSSIQEAIKTIEKQYKGGKVLVAGDMLPEVDLVSMGTLSFDYAVSGGLPLGGIVEFSGQFGSGKSTAAALALAQYQKQHPDKINIYVDVEDSLKMQLPFFKKMTGLLTDEEHLLVYDCVGKSADNILRDILFLETEVDNIGMIIIDSTASLVSNDDLVNDFEKDNGQRAATAKVANKFCKQMRGWLKVKGNILLTINQTVLEGKTFTGANIYNELGGKAWKFHSDMRIRFGSRTFVKDGRSDLSITKAEGATGFRLQFGITKSRIGAPNRGGGFITFSYDRGLETVADTVEVAIAGKYLQRPTNSTYIIVDLDTGEILKDDTGKDLKFVGKANLIEYLEQNDEFREKYFAELSKRVSGQTGLSLLDKDSMKEIIEMEGSQKKGSDENAN